MTGLSLDPPVLVRLLDEPLISPDTHHSVGTNINGPCVVRVPDWVTDPLGRFYMYFAHHTGRFIRLAFSDALTGPWQVHDVPPLDVSATGFAQSEVAWRDTRGETILEQAHIASPDVHVETASQQFVMLFHGLHQDGRQCTRLAVSRDGLSFDASEYDRDVAPPYLRLCKAGARYIGIAWGGEVFASDTLEGPFEKGPPYLERPNGPDLIPRHPALVMRNDVLHCFYTLIGDCPERIWHIPIRPSGTWGGWECGAPRLVVQPECAWEGAQLPSTASAIGAARGFENALRDPFVFEDHLFYAGGGESGIGVARITWP
jgi:hypothetical protein